MKQTTFTLFLSVLLSMVGLHAYASGIKVGGIYYNFNANTKTAEVTFEGSRYSYSNEYTGAVVIPSEVTYGGEKYSVTSIGDYAFRDCWRLTSVTIPNSVTSIGRYAFSDCSGLTSVTIPNSVTSIGESAFSDCYYLASVTIPNSVTIIKDHTFENCSGLTSVTISNSVKSIGESAFRKCSGLTSITIPNSVTSIGGYAFGECRGLTSITIPNSVTSIGSQAFFGCSGLTSITIPNSVTSIGSQAFSGCSGLTSVTIPNSVTSIGSGAFERCSGLTSIVVESENTKYDSRDNCNAIIITSSNHLVVGCKNTVIPNSVTSIGGRAFYGCSGLTSITIPNSVTSIGGGAFQYCSGLTSITIPNSVTSIGSGAFSGTAWYNNQPDGLVYAGMYVYAYKGTMPTNTSITIEQGTVGISNSAFFGCSGLTSITIPNSVTSIGSQAFYDCSGLTSVTALNPTPVDITWDVFAYCTNAILYVPKGSKSAYQAADYWKEFKGIVEITIPTHKLTYMVDGEEYKSYDIEEGDDITPEPAPTKEGYTFSGWSEIPETMPAHDVVVTGTFSVNSYTLTYKVDGEVYKTATIAYGTTITPEANPTKEGYTFSGWSEIPATMPAHDLTVTGTFTINKYKLTYTVDGVEYKSYDVEYGATITPEAEPTKEYYTFSGWSEIPTTMPAHDVTVTGTFTINKYKLTYMVDGEVYKTFNVEYGATITPEEEPTKEGYTFSRWSEIPATMPAHDVTITGTFTINKYKLTYIVDGVEYKSYDVEYGATITPEEEPTKEGYTFSGWSEIPTTMPAHDVTVTGTFTQETGIEQIMGSENGKTMIFTIDGKRVDNPKKGVNVIRMKDGTTRKVVVK